MTTYIRKYRCENCGEVFTDTKTEGELVDEVNARIGFYGERKSEVTRITKETVFQPIGTHKCLGKENGDEVLGVCSVISVKMVVD